MSRQVAEKLRARLDREAREAGLNIFLAQVSHFLKG
jgi:hypothetical protein